MRLVDDQGVVVAQLGVAVQFGQQDAVGHQLYERAIAHPVGEPDFVPHGGPESGPQFVGYSLADAAGGDAAGLGVADYAGAPPAGLDAHLGQLRALPRACLAGHHDDLVGG